MIHATPDPGLFEKLGAFYLGRQVDPATGETQPDLLLYDSKDLTTHAVCVGMTGSGKTGLCLGLLEEAAIDGIPAIAIDPKGDLGNLLLTFPDLDAASFRPWVDDGEAARKGSTPDQYAQQVADTWREGLAAWGQGPERIRRLKDAAEFAIYTPGASFGRPISVLRSLSAPSPAVREDADQLRDRIGAAVAGLLGLLDVDADPVTSREHILLSAILSAAWEAGNDLDLAQLIQQVQNPPMAQVGVMDVETFFPQKDRFGLAMRLNALLASPGFAAWREGEPLDIKRLLWTAEGKPRIAVLSLAHLSDSERMFFVTVLLSEIIAWMRSQPGTPSLRALLYMDEIFGFFPPSANPPSKTPMLTLLKQARAYGLGVVLATQNPVDLDYKGLSNTGTWFLGRLQTERDKLRVLDGLEGASSQAGQGFNRGEIDKVLSGLGSRRFLLHNVHDTAPVLFETRWVMSYLRGPLTRSQIEQLSERPAAAASAPFAPVSSATPVASSGAPSSRPIIPAEGQEGFVIGAASRYVPMLMGTADLHFVKASTLDVWETGTWMASLESVGTDLWSDAERVDEAPQITDQPAEGATFVSPDPEALNKKAYDTWNKMFKTHLYQDVTLSVFTCKELKLKGTAGESEAEFRVRMREAVREKRDDVLATLRKKYEPKVRRLEEKIRKAQAKVEVQASQYQSQKMQTAVSVGATVLGALLGRRAASIGTLGRATTAVRGAGRAAREKQDIARAQADMDAAQEDLAALEAEFQEAADAATGVEADHCDVETADVRPRKADITVRSVRVVWVAE